MLAAAVIPALVLLGAPPVPHAPAVAGLGAGARIVHVPPLAAAVGADYRLEVPLGGERLTLELAPWSVRGEGFRCYEAGAGSTLTAVDPGPVTTLRGRIVGVEGSVAAGGLVPGGVLLGFTLPDGRTGWLEPAAPHDPGAAPGAHLLYTSHDVMPGPWRCGNDDVPQRPAAPTEDGGTAVRGASLHEAELACDADYEYYTRWGGGEAVRQRIEAITATVNLQFERDVGITHRLGVIVVRTTEDDPYTTGNPVALNAQISAAWASMTAPYDLLMLYTGRDVTGTVVGRANAIGSVCQGHNSNCFAQSDYNGLYASACDLTAHELGHLWGACHCACASPAFTMNSSITSVNRFGGPVSFCGAGSIQEIVAYRSTRQCLDVLPAEPGPPNDSCARAPTLDRGLWGYSTLGATASPEGGGVVPPGCAPFGADVWYRFAPACGGTAVISVCSSSFDTLLAVYTGPCDDLTLVACSDNAEACGGGGSRVTFSTAFGAEYLIRIGSPEGVEEGTGLLSISHAGCIAPANNSCSGALVLHPGVPAAFSTVGATAADPLEPALCDSQGFQGFGPDVWFRYTAMCAGPVRLSTCGSTFDTRLAVYTACPTAPGSAIACSDEDGPACGGSAASLDFSATAGTTYLIRLGGTNNQQGTGTILVTPLTCPPPANNDCSAAAPAPIGSLPFDTAGATTDGPATQCAAFEGQVQHDVWFTLVAPCAAPLRIAVCESSFDARLALYTDCPGAGGTLAACSDNACGPTGLGPQVIHAAPAGATLLVRVGSAALSGGGQGTLTVSIAADWDGNGSVDSLDISAFITAWLLSVQGGMLRHTDFSGDGGIDSADLSAFLTAWIASVSEDC